MMVGARAEQGRVGESGVRIEYRRTEEWNGDGGRGQGREGWFKRVARE